MEARRPAHAGGGGKAPALAPSQQQRRRRCGAVDREAGSKRPGRGASGGWDSDHVRRLHRHAPVDHEGSSTLVQHIKVPVHLVSSVPSSSSLQWLDSSYTAAIPSLLTTSASSMEDLRHVFHGLLVQLVLRQWRMQSMCLMVCLCSTDQLTMLDLANRDSYLTEKRHIQATCLV